MPELPEVETFLQDLKPKILGATVVNCHVLDGRSLKKFDGNNEDFVANIIGRTVVAMHRRAKFLWLVLDSGKAILAHLGMSGQFRVDKNTSTIEDCLIKHIRIKFLFQNGSQNFWVYFCDQRIFGSLTIATLIPDPYGSSLVIPEAIKHITPDMYDFRGDMNVLYEKFWNKCQKSTMSIKKILLDQKIIGGVGNIYADELLWQLNVHPDSVAKNVPHKILFKFPEVLHNIFVEAVKSSGTSFDSQYVNLAGISGYFVVALQVYGKQGNKCSRCENDIIKIKFMNRHSHLCSQCQIKY